MPSAPAYLIITGFLVWGYIAWRVVSLLARVLWTGAKIHWDEYAKRCAAGRRGVI